MKGRDWRRWSKGCLNFTASRKLDQSKSAINPPVQNTASKNNKSIMRKSSNRKHRKYFIVGYLTKLDFVKQLIIKLELKTVIIE